MEKPDSNPEKPDPNPEQPWGLVDCDFSFNGGRAIYSEVGPIPMKRVTAFGNRGDAYHIKAAKTAEPTETPRKFTLKWWADIATSWKLLWVFSRL